MSAYSMTNARAGRIGASAPAGFGARVAAFARSRVEAFLQAREARKAYRHVMAMTDHQLRDIGLSRAEIKARVFGPPTGPRSFLD